MTEIGHQHEHTDQLFSHYQTLPYLCNIATFTINLKINTKTV